MKSVFMDKNATLWLMKNIEHTVVGINPKQFFMFREGDTAYTLQRGANSFGQFFLVSELKLGGHRRSVIIPRGKAQNGWKVFGLRKMLEPGQYALGDSSQAKFVSQPQRRMSGFHPSRSFVEALKVQKLTGAKVGDILVGKPDTMVVGGRDRREQCINVDTKLGEQILVSWDNSKGGVKNFKWVSRAHIKDVVGLDTNCDQQVGFPNLELTGPIRMEVGESSLLADPSPPKPEAHMSAMVVMATALHKASLSQNELGQLGELQKVVDVTVDGGSQAEKLPAPVIQVRNQALATATGVDNCEIMVCHIETMDLTHSMRMMKNPDGDYEKMVGCLEESSLEKECQGCTEYLQKMILGSKMLSGGMVSEDTRSITLEFVSRLIGPSFPKHFLEFWRVGSVGFGASGQEVNSFSSKELLSLSGEVMVVEDVADFSTGFGETELTDCLPLRIIAPSASTTSAKLEEVIEALSIEAKLDISRWVKHKIPGFSKLVGLSMTWHEKLCIALLQRLETEMEAANVLHRKGTSSQKVAKSKNKGRRELRNLISSADRIAGSILIMWDKRVLDKVEIMVGTFSVSVKWQGVEDGFIWACLRVYGPNENNERGHMWGETRLTLTMETFSEFVEDLNLIDLPLEGGSYTWSSGTDQPAISRIDRALVTPNWEEHFPNVFQRILPRPIFDHSPILLEARGLARGKKHQKKQLLEELTKLDAKEGDLGLTNGEKWHRANLRSQMEHLLSLEEISWRQKSRMLCIKEGDNNTKFFHKMANSHRWYNHLKTLEVDGVVFEEEPKVTNQVVQFYKNLYKESKGWRPFVEGLEFGRIGDMERIWLERKFEREDTSSRKWISTNTRRYDIQYEEIRLKIGGEESLEMVSS
uniref:Uncharacterized protein n=1 Tax=Quercus lobata TaxID=97700 RepID=A0A7N2M4C3_QUELO